MEIAKGGMTVMTSYSRRGELRPSHGNEKRDGRAKECDKGENRLEPRSNGQDNRFTLHYGGPRMPDALKVLSTIARAI